MLCRLLLRRVGIGCLVIVLLVQMGYCVLWLSQYKVRVPEILFEKAKQWIDPSGLVIKQCYVGVEKNGKVSVGEVLGNYWGYGIRCERIAVGFGLDLDIRGVEIIMNSARAILSIDKLDICIKKEGYYIRKIKGKLGGIELCMEDVWVPKSEHSSWDDQAIHQVIERYLPYVNSMRNAWICLKGEKNNKVRYIVGVESIVLDVLSVHNVSLCGDWGSEGVLYAQAIGWKDFRVKNVGAVIDTHSNAHTTVYFYGYDLGKEDKKIADFSGLAKLFDHRFLNIQAYGYEASTSVCLKSNWDLQYNKGLIHVNLEAEPPFINTLQQLLAQDSDQRCSFQKKIQLKGRLNFEDKMCLGDIDFSFGTIQCVLFGIDIDSIKGSITKKDTLWVAKDVIVKTPLFTVRGEYRHDRLSSDYRFLLNGSIEPLLINEWMDSWWPSLWKDFAFKATLPVANVDVQGNWDKRDRLLVYGVADATDFVFRGVDVDDCHLYFWAVPQYLELFDMYLKRPEGQAHLNIEWVYKSTLDTEAYATLFTANTLVDLLPAATMLQNESIVETVNMFNCSSPPRIYAEGVLYGPMAKDCMDTVYINASISDALSLENIPLEYLSFEAKKEGIVTNVESISFGIAQGKATGNLRLEERPNHTLLGFDIDIKEAAMDELMMFGQYTKKFRDATSQVSTEKTKTPLGGKADIRVKGDGLKGDFKSFSAEGTLYLQEADLGQIHLFGGLSKQLNHRIFNLGNFNLNTLKTDFTLTESTLRLKTLDIWGPTAKIAGDGYYDLGKDQLNFDMHLYLLGGLQIPIISQILYIVDPLSKIFLLKLNGSLDQPVWQIKVSPFGVIK